jgi:molybdopterin molybdotransferase
MTGAPIPEGADCVIMIEDTEEKGNKIKISRLPDKKNICSLGEDVRKGDLVLEKGTRIMPQHVSVMATVGYLKPFVYRQPLVAIIVTGNEIVEPHVVPEESKIRNSNGYQLLSQLIRCGCKVDYKGIVPDRTDELEHTIKYSFEESRILIITGGASKGDFDLVPDVIRQLGFKTHFKEVAIQPGKPFSFSTRKNLVCFGLSGNPVSSFVQFELLVKPYLQSVLGMSITQPQLKIPMNESFSRKRAEREYFFPVGISEDTLVIPLEFHGSAHVNALTNAYGIGSMPIGKTQFEKGELVNVRPL